MEGQGWFISYHIFARYVKATFFKGKSLEPMSPVDSKDPDARYYHIFEEGMDVGQMEEWVRQATAVPGWDGFRGKILYRVKRYSGY